MCIAFASWAFLSAASLAKAFLLALAVRASFMSLSEASASDYAHKCEVLSASLRDSQAHCRDLEKQIETSLSKVALGHEAVRRLQDELVTKSVEVSTEHFQSRDLRSQLESLAEEHKRQTEV